MPQLGSYHDDAILWLSARSLALNQGYRISHLPEEPAQTKYPPLYPALLSLVWRFAGASSSGNLPLLMALQWGFYALYVGLVSVYLFKCGFNPPVAVALTSIVSLSPITILLGTSPLTEVPFSAILLILILLLESTFRGRLAHLSEIQIGLFTGLVAAIAFLTRTNSIVLLVSVPLVLILQSRVRRALGFLVPMACSIAGWQLWCFWNGARASDDAISYYTSYAGFYVRTFSWADFPHRMWVNLAAIFESMGRLVIFSVDNTLAMRVLYWLISAIAAAGIVSLYKKGLRHYPLFAALLVVTLVLWQYPPDTRFVFPLLPLYLAGLATKLRQVGELAVVTWRERRGADRAAVVVTFAFILFLAVTALGATFNGVYSVLPRYFMDSGNQRAEMAPVYAWISSHTKAQDRFAAYDDPLLYLNTGRQGYTAPLLPRLVYDQDPAEVKSYISGLGSLWEQKRVSYVLVTKYDFRRDLHETALDSLEEMVRNRARFQLLYSDPVAQVYRLQLNATHDGAAQ